MRWRLITLVFVIPVAVLGTEILMVRGTPNIDPFPPGDVGGTFGDPARAERIVWIGDSTGVGVGSSSADAALPRMVMRGLGTPVSLTVLAESGARVRDAVEEQLPRVAALQPKRVFVAVGSNDVIHLTRRARFRDHFDTLLSSLKSIPGVERVVVLGMGHFSSTPLFPQPLRWIVGARAHRLNRDVRAAAQRNGALFVDIIKSVGEEFVDDPARYHARDRFHPNDLGYELWAHATLRALGRT